MESSSMSIEHETPTETSENSPMSIEHEKASETSNDPPMHVENETNPTGAVVDNQCITLVSADGVKFKVPYKRLCDTEGKCYSGLIGQFVGDAFDDDNDSLGSSEALEDIPLPEVDSKVLKKVHSILYNFYLFCFNLI